MARLVLFLWAVALFSAVAFMLLHNQYLSDIILREVSDHIVRSGGDTRADLILGNLPYDLPTAIYDLTARIFGRMHEVVPIITAIISTAGLIWLAATPADERPEQRPGLLWTGLFVAAIALNPIVLWVATATGGHALAVLIFAYLCSTLTQIAERQDPGAYLKFGLAAMLFIMTDPTAIIMCIAMIPWIILTKPRNETVQQPFAYYLVTFTPVAMTALSVCYLNWAGIDRVSPFITSLNADHGQDFIWDHALNATGLAERLDIVPIFMIAAVAFFPVLVLSRPFDTAPDKRAFAVVLLTIFTAPAIAALGGTPYHVLDYLPYLTGPLVMIARQTAPNHRMTTLGIQIASVALGWMLLSVPGEALSNGWMQAVTGTKIAGHADEEAIAKWIAKRHDTIIVDPTTDYRVIALTGRSDNLVMPVNVTNQTTDLRSISHDVLTMNPDTDQGEIDRLNALKPTIWAFGMPGYKLAFERGIYRIWTQVTQP
ncbi:glycosyltransferase family 39 protein [Komagataeibacter europaeus]|uniref:glycosyltransferase family 39 protein n=1 Tax=Komagataeibacter europaeus TaxID=33995 RepID=UPI0012FBBF4A|nr:glycosyltransferase family 39 protein [Komagataeibacter europaeus]